MVCTLTPAKNRLALSGFLQVPHLQEVFVAVAGLFLSFLKITVPWLCQDPLPLPFPGKLLINIPGSDGPTKASVVFSHVTPASLLQSLEHREWAAAWAKPFDLQKQSLQADGAGWTEGGSGPGGPASGILYVAPPSRQLVPPAFWTHFVF